MASIRLLWGLLLAGAVPVQMTAQTSTTNCQIFGNQVRCNTQQGVMQLQGWGEDLGKNLGNVVSQVMIARRRAQAQKAYTVALQEAEQRARAEAEANQRAIEEATKRAQAQAEAVEDREQARQRLFAEKAISVVVETSEAMRFQGKVQGVWVQAVSSTLQDLYKVNPEASRLQIFDAIAPKLNIILRARGDYARRHIANEPLFSRYQRLQLNASTDSAAYRAFWDPVYRETEPLFMEWPDEINVERFAAVVEPIFLAAEKRKASGLTLTPRTAPDAAKRIGKKPPPSVR
jgi:hypothetical protein